MKVACVATPPTRCGPWNTRLPPDQAGPPAGEEARLLPGVDGGEEAVLLLLLLLVDREVGVRTARAPPRLGRGISGPHILWVVFFFFFWVNTEVLLSVVAVV